MWSLATRLLDEALTRRGVEFHVAEGEGAFYGPKIDFMVSDALQRRHQLGTCQLDFQMPERFGLEYVTADDGRARPVMVHRAVLGSIERFMGILIEHTGGNFPVWLAPLQVVVIPIADEHREYAGKVARRLRKAGYRVEVDAGQDRMQAKIAVAETQHIPYMLVCGDREAESGEVAVRGRGRKNLGSERIESFLERIGSVGVFPPL
jgi:threonyl-tRNA synthetase